MAVTFSQSPDLLGLNNAVSIPYRQATGNDQAGLFLGGPIHDAAQVVGAS